MTVQNNMKFLLVLLVVIVIVMSLPGCQRKKSISAGFTPADFPNVLEIRNVPATSDDWDAFCHSDQGAWFGFGLPPENMPELIGAFTGPFLMSEGSWLAASILQLNLSDNKGHKLDLSKCTNFSANYFPGRLQQSYSYNELKIIQELIFTDSVTALSRMEIINKARSRVEIKPGWSGNIFNNSAGFKHQSGSVIVPVSKSEVFRIQFPADVNPQVETDDSIYTAIYDKPLIIEAGNKVQTFVTLTLIPNEARNYTYSQEEVDNAFQANQQRWAKYLESALKTSAPWQGKPEYRQVAVKAVMTLINNWKSARGDLHYGGLFPSYAVWYFNGFWAWDSWKHAVALATFAPEIARDQIRVMFDWQDDAGMVPDVIYADKSENNNRDTKPPLAAWAVWAVYNSDGDRNFLREMYPLLKKYHRWWYENRDVNDNGLCEYGSTDGTIEAARWESGMDNAIRFDSTKMLKSGPTAWSMDQESVDLNAYLFADKNYLAKIAASLGHDKESENWQAEATELQSIVQNNMYDPHSGYFHDIKLETGRSILPFGPEGWIPLWSELAAADQAGTVLNVMRDTTRFATYLPFPTVAADSREFSQGYWRGPVWLDQVYFAVTAFNNYGFSREAEAYTKQLFTNAEGLMNSHEPIRENYWPLDGKGMRVNHFSWSAAHILLLYQGLN